MKQLSDKELDKVERQVKEKIGEREGLGDFGLRACVESVICDLKRSAKCDVCEVRRRFLNAKEKQGWMWNDRMFKALNMVEAEIYGLRY